MENRREFSSSGICLLICEYQLPDLPKTKAGARIEGALKKFGEAIFQSAEAALPSLSETYDKNPDPHKKLRNRPLLLSLCFDCEERKRFFRITLHLRLSRCGRTLAKKEGAARFDKQSGYPLASREKKSIPKD